MSASQILANGEQLMPLHVAIEKVTGTRPPLKTGYRWISKGCRGVKLERVRFGNQSYRTSVEAVVRFLDEISKDEPKKRRRRPDAESPMTAAERNAIEEGLKVHFGS